MKIFHIVMKDGERVPCTIKYDYPARKRTVHVVGQRIVSTGHTLAEFLADGMKVER